jgi:hypothetical protein
VGTRCTGATLGTHVRSGDLRSFDVSYAELNRVVDFADGYFPRGFIVLDEKRSAALFDSLGLDDDAHPPRS